MIKALLTFVCFLWIFSPGAFAQSADRPAHIAVYPEDVAFENLCAPDFFYEELFEPEAMALTVALDDDLVEKLRIELLERGFDPGFVLDAVDADERLAEAIRGFQAEFYLPVTGQPDAATLAMLSLRR
jgi:hypothetical protein